MQNVLYAPSENLWFFKRNPSLTTGMAPISSSDGRARRLTQIAMDDRLAALAFLG